MWLHLALHPPPATPKKAEKFGEEKARTSPTLPAEGPDADPLPSSASSHTLGSVQLAAARTHAVMMARVMVWSLEEAVDAMAARQGKEETALSERTSGQMCARGHQARGRQGGSSQNTPH